MLMMALAPVIGTAIAWVFLGEVLKPIEILAIFITLGGIAWVIKERQEDGTEPKKYSAGILCGLGGACGQALGLILSKQGLSDGIAPLSGNFIRVLVAVISLWLLTGITGRVKATVQRMTDSKAMGYLSGGVIFGPFLGVWLSLVAVQHTYVGIASTLMALPPIILIPLSHWVLKEKITLGAVIGTIIAIAGVAILFLV
jgi:drug/metabolite transporter (DMT)-like permease